VAIGSPPVDPSKPDEVRKALLRYLAERGLRGARFASGPTAVTGGFDTLIYAFRLEGEMLPEAWRQPLVVRIYAAFDQDARAGHEARVQQFAAENGYPALLPLAVEGAGNALGFPLMVVPQVTGGTLARRMQRNPLGIGRTLARMAELQAALHRIPLDGCPLPYERPLVVRQLASLWQRIERRGLGHLKEGFAWLVAHQDKVGDEAPALCHADFHPLNVLVDGAGKLVVIDWTEADVGDRHFDVARTLAVFWFAKLGARGLPERMLLHAARGFLRNRYLDEYRRRAPVDLERLRYWEAFHVFAACLLLAELPFDTRVAQPKAVRSLHEGFEEEVRQRFWRCAERSA
jgi:aminoglycoside phosphotransferase (APT) family kinase protein